MAGALYFHMPAGPARLNTQAAELLLHILLEAATQIC
jgi:hypothetical protein